MTVLDADGRSLPARLESVPEGLLLTVDERGARYPLTIDPIAQQAYLKASNTDGGDEFGRSVSVSGDTVVVGASGENSNATGVNGDQSDNSAGQSGAAYVFVRSGATWSQQAYLKASNTEGGFWFGDFFSWSVSVSGDTVVVGAYWEASNATGVNGDQFYDSTWGAGAAYVFVRSGTIWSQHAYLKASNTDATDHFGWSVAASSDTVVVGAYSEDSTATGVNGDQTNNGASYTGAAYVFDITLGTWTGVGHALAGTHGDPILIGTGPLVEDALVTLTLTNALVSADATLVVGLSNQSLPFKGGVLVPSSDFVVPNLRVGTDSSLVVSGRWPGGLPSGFTTYSQVWIADPAGPEGFAASNAISSTTP